MPSLTQLAEQAEKAILEAPDYFKQAAPTAAPPQNQNTVIKALADKIRGDAAKIGVMFSDNDSASLSVSETEGLLSSLQQAVEALCLSLHALRYQEGPTLRDGLQASAIALAKQCAALVKAVAQQPAAGSAVKHAVATVWDACDTVTKQPLDNRSALFKQLGLVVRVGKDTLREMDDLVTKNNSTAEGNGHSVQEGDAEGEDSEEDESGLVSVEVHGEAVASGGTQGQQPAAGSNTATPTTQSQPGQRSDRPGEEAEEEEEEEEEDDMGADLDDADFTDEPLSANQKEVLLAGRQLMQLAVQALQLLARPLVTGPALTLEEVEGWESAVWHTRALKRGLEDLGAALYAPQDCEEICESSEAIVISLECMMDETPGVDDNGPVASQIRDLQTQVAMVKSRLDALLGNQPDGHEP